MGRCALLLLLLAALPVRAGDFHALIITGATDKAAATKLFDAAKKKAEPLAKLLTFAPGFPKIEDSATVKGMKPGFFVVVAGYCTDVALLTAVKAIDPGAYTKPVQVDAEACPAVTSGWSVSATEVKDKDSRVLRGTIFQSGNQDDSWQLFLSLRDKAGAVLLERAVEENAAGCMSGGEAKVTARSGTLVVKTSDCTWARGCPNPGSATTAMTFTPLADRIGDAVETLKDSGYKGCGGE